MDLRVILTALGTGLLSGIIATVITLLIERFGGTIGGLLGTTPTTIVPACIGIAVETATSGDLQEALVAAVPPGIALDVMFLVVWRVLPAVLPSRWSFSVNLVIITAASLLLWFLGALGVVYGLRGLKSLDVDIRFVGVGVLAVHIVFALVTVVFFPKPSPVGSRGKPSPLTLFLRGLMTGLAIMSAVLIATVSEVAAGLASVFPAIFLTTMLTISIYQRTTDVSGGAVGPMMLGCTSVSAFAVGFGFIEPLFDDGLGWKKAPSIVMTCVICYVISVCCFSLPSYRLLRWRTRSLEAAAADETTEHTPLLVDDEEESLLHVSLDVEG